MAAQHKQASTQRILLAARQLKHLVALPCWSGPKPTRMEYIEAMDALLVRGTCCWLHTTAEMRHRFRLCRSLVLHLRLMLVSAACIHQHQLAKLRLGNSNSASSCRCPTASKVDLCPQDFLAAKNGCIARSKLLTPSMPGAPLLQALDKMTQQDRQKWFRAFCIDDSLRPGAAHCCDTACCLHEWHCQMRPWLSGARAERTRCCILCPVSTHACSEFAQLCSQNAL